MYFTLTLSISWHLGELTCPNVAFRSRDFSFSEGFNGVEVVTFLDGAKGPLLGCSTRGVSRLQTR